MDADANKLIARNTSTTYGTDLVRGPTGIGCYDFSFCSPRPPPHPLPSPIQNDPIQNDDSTYKLCAEMIAYVLSCDVNECLPEVISKCAYYDSVWKARSAATGGCKTCQIKPFVHVRSTTTIPIGKVKDPKRYKTVLCTNWVQFDRCRYGHRCQFAHGKEELRSHTNLPLS